MIYLFSVSLIWAFSFGLIKGHLTGLDPNWVAAARLLIAALVFLPFLLIQKMNRQLALKLAATGAIQFGLMYIAYFHAFQYLQAYEIALFTILTPIYITLLNDFFQGKINYRNIATVLLAVAGTAVIQYKSLENNDILVGFMLVQIANLCFAAGQILYREVMATKKNIKDFQVFGYLYIGAALISSLFALATVNTPFPEISTTQGLTLIYLGVVASGLGFFLWNFGARRVEGGTLAIFNNLKIPLAILVSLYFFGEKAEIMPLFTGGAIVVLALVINEWDNRRSNPATVQS